MPDPTQAPPASPPPPAGAAPALSPGAVAVIAAEFGYVAQTAFQAHEDRARASQYFLLTFGTVIAALYSSKLGEPGAVDGDTRRAFQVLFGVLVLYGAITLLQLAKLRLAWVDSVAAMGTIKGTLGLAPAWRERPRVLKLWSVGFLHAVLVASLSAVSAGAASAIGGLGAGGVDWRGLTLWVPAWTLLMLGAFYLAPLRIAERKAG